jgi:hypothetical protein
MSRPVAAKPPAAAEPGAVSELRGLSRLAIDATAGLVDLIEAVHETVERPFGVLALPVRAPIKGIRELAYGSVCGITQLVGATIDIVLAQLAPLLDPDNPWPGREPLRAARNGVLGDYLAASSNEEVALELRVAGVLGDYLAASSNPLAIGMSLRYEQRRL